MLFLLIANFIRIYSKFVVHSCLFVFAILFTMRIDGIIGEFEIIPNFVYINSMLKGRMDICVFFEVKSRAVLWILKRMKSVVTVFEQYIENIYYKLLTNIIDPSFILKTSNIRSFRLAILCCLYAVVLLEGIGIYGRCSRNVCVDTAPALSPWRGFICALQGHVNFVFTSSDIVNVWAVSSGPTYFKSSPMGDSICPVDFREHSKCWRLCVVRQTWSIIWTGIIHGCECTTIRFSSKKTCTLRKCQFESQLTFHCISFQPLKLDQLVTWSWEVVFVPMWIVLCLSLVGMYL